MLRAIIAVVSIGLTIFALADCIQTDDDKLRGLPRWAWIVLIVLLPWVGPLTWLLVGKERRGGLGVPGRGGTGAGGRGPTRKGPSAPDEDPDFLRKLDADIRRERRERIQRQQEEDDRRGGEADSA